MQVQLPGETPAPPSQLLSGAGEPVIDVEASATESVADLPIPLPQAAANSAAAATADAPQLPSAAAAGHADSTVLAQPADMSNDQDDAAHGPAASITSGVEAHDGGSDWQGGADGGDAADIAELAAALEDLRRIQDRAKVLFCSIALQLVLSSGEDDSQAVIAGTCLTYRLARHWTGCQIKELLQLLQVRLEALQSQIPKTN